MKRIGVIGAAGLGCLGLLAYAPGWRLLGSIRPGYIPMAPATAVSLLILAAALAMPVDSRVRPVLWLWVLLVGVVTLFGILELTGFFVGADLNFEDRMLPDFGQLGGVPVGRMSPSTGVSFFVLGLGILVLQWKKLRESSENQGPLQWIPSLTATVVLLGSLTFLLGYLLGTPLLYDQQTIPMAMTTAGGLFLLSLAVIAESGPAHFPLKMFWGDSTYARLMRMFLPLSVGAILAHSLISQFLPSLIEMNEAWGLGLLLVVVGTITAIVVDRASYTIGEELDRSRRKLYASRGQYRSLFNSIRDAIIVADRNRRILSCNQGFSDTFGYSESEIQGEKSFRLYENKEEYEAVGDALLRDDQEDAVVRTIRYRKKNGEVFPGETGISYLRDEAGAVVGFIGLIRDVSERQRIEKRLQEAQRLEAVGTLAGGIAHDFNNILASIMGFTDLALEELEGSTAVRDHLEEVLVAGHRARDLVRQILAISRRGSEEVLPVDTVPLIKEAMKMLRATIPTSIEFRTRFCEESLVVEINPTKLHQVLVNLVTNARQAMDDGPGILEVSVDRVELEPEGRRDGSEPLAGSYARIRVRDTGKGIRDEHLDRIFEPYFTTKEKATGTGLGLSVVHGIVDGIGGKISVKSRKGEGATFEVDLPLVDKQAVLVDEAPAPRLPRGDERILLVDDEAAIVRIEKKWLEGLGYQVCPSTRGEEAWEELSEHPGAYDLLITDMTMPGMTGDLLAQKARTLRANFPVILCTGFSEKVVEGRETMEVDYVMMKPVSREELAETVRKALDGSRESPVGE